MELDFYLPNHFDVAHARACLRAANGGALALDQRERDALLDCIRAFGNAIGLDSRKWMLVRSAFIKLGDAPMR